MSKLEINLASASPSNLQVNLGIEGPRGYTGSQGSQGIQGETGLNGEGVAAGGYTNQFLTKLSGSDFDTGWVDLDLSGYLPLTGGTMSGTLYASTIRNPLNENFVIDAYNDDAAGTHNLFKFNPFGGGLELPTGSAGIKFGDGTDQTTAFNFTGYDYEIHVSQVDGNDTTGDGSLLKPYASITQGLTAVTSQRKTVIVHAGGYTENPSITQQYTVLTTIGQIGGNTVITGTVSTNKGCTISGLKMTNLVINAPTGTGNVNILNCDISATLTKSNNADYTLIRFCDIGATSITSSAGLIAIFGGNPNFITVNNAGARVIVKNAVTVSPVLLAGNANFVDSIILATGATSNALTTSAGTIVTLANSQVIVPSFNNVARVSLSGFYSIFNCVYDKPNSTLVASSATGGSTNSIDYFQQINADGITYPDSTTQVTAGLPLTGGTMTGNLVINDSVDPTLYKITAGLNGSNPFLQVYREAFKTDIYAGVIVLYEDNNSNTISISASNGITYADATIQTTAYSPEVLAGYLPLTGGTLDGSLILNKAGDTTNLKVYDNLDNGLTQIYGGQFSLSIGASNLSVTGQGITFPDLTNQTTAFTTSLLTPYAPLASPTFTGDPKAPTPVTADNDTSIATTAFVKNQGYVKKGSTILNTSIGEGLIIENSASGSIGLRVYNSSVSNYGYGIVVNNSGVGEGMFISNSGTGTNLRITNTGTGDCIRIEDSTSPDATPFIINNSGRVGIGLEPDAVVALKVDSTGLMFSNGSIQTVAATSPDLSDYAQLSGATFTGKVSVSAGSTTAPLNISTGVSPSTNNIGDIWIGTTNLAYRDSTNTLRNTVATSTSNSFTNWQNITQSSSAIPSLTVVQSGNGGGLKITNTGTGESFRVEDNTSPDSTAFVVSNNGRTGIGVAPDTTVALSIDDTGIKVNGAILIPAGEVTDAPVTSGNMHHSEYTKELLITINGVNYAIVLRAV